MSEYVTDEAVKRAAEAMYVAERPATGGDWSREGDEYRSLYTDSARAALEASAPLIAAQALRDAADGYQTGGWADDLPAGGSRPALILGMSQRAVAWLRARADEIAGADRDLPLHRTEAGYPRCSTCDGGGCPDCTDPA